MFCENCGHKVQDGGRFCPHCGAPLDAPVQTVQPEQTEQTVPVQPEQAPVEQQAYTPAEPQQPAYGEQQPYAPAEPQQTPPYGNQQGYAPVQPAAPKKPMSKKTKMIILFSSIGAAVIAAALIVLFVVIIPMINKANEEAGKIDLLKYVTVEIEGIDKDAKDKTVFDGTITGTFVPDYDKFIADQKLKEGTSKYDTALYNIGSYASVSAVKKSGEKNADDSDMSFNSAKKDDVFTLTVEWPTADSENGKRYLEEIALYEKEYGVKFSMSKKTVDVKLGDLLTAADITVKEPVQADILGYIKDNNLIYSRENSSGTYNVYIKEFETTFGDFKFTKNKYYSMSIDITDKNGETVDYIYLEFDKDSDYCKSGDELTLDYEEYYKSSAAEDGILLIGDPVKYTVSGSKTEGTTEKQESKTSSKTESSSASSKTESSSASSKTESSSASSKAESASSENESGLSVEDAKKCIDSLKSYLTDNVYDEDDKAAKGDKIEVKSIYYVHDKDSSYRRIVFVYENTSKKYFRAMETDPENFKVSGNKAEPDFVYLSPSEAASTLEEATKNNWYLSDTYSDLYDSTKLF